MPLFKLSPGQRASITLHVPRREGYDGPAVDPEIPTVDAWAAQVLGSDPSGTDGPPATHTYTVMRIQDGKTFGGTTGGVYTGDRKSVV